MTFIVNGSKSDDSGAGGVCGAREVKSERVSEATEQGWFGKGPPAHDIVGESEFTRIPQI